MENSTLISHELEEMRSQIGILKDKLAQQTIINEQHIRRSMRSKVSDMNRTVTITICLGIFALIYCTWFLYHLGCSLTFTIATAVMLTVCIGLTIAQKAGLSRMDFSKGNIIQTAERLNKIKTHYQHWYKIAIPMILIWAGWLAYEMIVTVGLSGSMAIGVFCGAGTGVLIGGFFGFRINRNIVRKAEEILDQIDDLQREG